MTHRYSADNPVFVHEIPVGKVDLIRTEGNEIELALPEQSVGEVQMTKLQRTDREG